MSKLGQLKAQMREYNPQLSEPLSRADLGLEKLPAPVPESYLEIITQVANGGRTGTVFEILSWEAFLEANSDFSLWTKPLPFEPADIEEIDGTHFQSYVWQEQLPGLLKVTEPSYNGMIVQLGVMPPWDGTVFVTLEELSIFEAPPGTLLALGGEDKDLLRQFLNKKDA